MELFVQQIRFDLTENQAVDIGKYGIVLKRTSNQSKYYTCSQLTNVYMFLARLQSIPKWIFTKQDNLYIFKIL